MIPVVCFFTKNTPYEQEALEMEESLWHFGIKGVTFYPVDHQGQWVRNCALKPKILTQACEDLKTPFLYVDADARFTNEPILFDTDWSHYDLGVHFFKDRELLTGTIYVNPTNITIQLFKYWYNYCMNHPGAWDQRALATILPLATGLKIMHLPPEYTFIYDLSKQFYGPEVAERAVITHYQASRKYRRYVPVGKG
jgi:hypothetical protein